MININKRLIRRTLIVFALIIIAMIVSFSVVEYLSWKNVSFNLSKETDSIKIYSKDDYSNDGDGMDIPALGELKGSGSVKLKVGSYYVSPTGDDVSGRLLEIEVKNDTSFVEIKPYYSEEYLSTAFSNDIKTIKEIMQSKYASSINDYRIDNGVFYRYGDWYGTSIFKEPGSGGVPNIYGVILHKVDNRWVVAAPPKMVYSYSEYKSIPADVIDSVNQYVNGL